MPRGRHPENVSPYTGLRVPVCKGTYTQEGGGLMLQGYTMAIVPCGNPTPKKLPTGGGEWPTFHTARAQRTVRPHNPCDLRGPQRYSRRQNQQWPTSGPSGYMTPTASGVPNISERGTKSSKVHKWAGWLHHPCRLGTHQRFRAGNKISNAPQVGYYPRKRTPHSARGAATVVNSTFHIPHLLSVCQT